MRELKRNSRKSPGRIRESGDYAAQIVEFLASPQAAFRSDHLSRKSDQCELVRFPFFLHAGHVTLSAPLS